MNKRLFRYFSVVSLMTLLSRILGFVRDIVLAHYFGATAAFDAFLVAFKIPNFMRRLFAEGAFSQAFVPILSEYKERQSEQVVRDFISHTASALFASLLLLVIVAQFVAPLLVRIFAPGFIDDPEQLNLTGDLLRITFPYLPLISLVALFSAIMNCWNRFAIPAFTPTFLNISLLVSAICFRHYFDMPVKVLAWGVVAAGIVQVIFQSPFLWRMRLFPRPKKFWKDAGVKRVLRLMLPALFGVSVAQISLLIDTLFASFLTSGSITWLYYSERMVYFPLGIFGVALSTVIMPQLSKQHARQSYDEFSTVLNDAIKILLLISVPATVSLVILALPILSTLFQSGAFGENDVIKASYSLQALALGLPAFMGVKVLISGFYARQTVKTPVKIAVAALLTNVVLNAVFIVPLAHAGLALATALASWLNVVLLYYYLKRSSAYTARYGILFFIRLLLPSVILGALLFFISPEASSWLLMGRIIKIIWLGALVIGGIGTYFVLLKIFGISLRAEKTI